MDNLLEPGRLAQLMDQIRSANDSGGSWIKQAATMIVEQTLNAEHSYPVSFARRGLTDGSITVGVVFELRGNPRDGIKLLGSSTSVIGKGSYRHLPNEPQTIQLVNYANDPTRWLLRGQMKSVGVGNPVTYEAVADVIEAGKMEIDWVQKVPKPRNADGVGQSGWPRVGGSLDRS
jgi:hypothetical protein